jgi:hypothetical protein
MSDKTNFVDESRLLRANQAFVNLLTFVVIYHVLLQVSLVAKNLSTECARNFVYDMSVPYVVLEYTVGGIIFVANITRENFFQFSVLQFDVSTTVTGDD